MPKYSFSCECGMEFTRVLRIGENLTHTCPSCSQTASRVFDGFGFGFAEGKTPGNSGVAKLDVPTADNIVGRDAEKRHEYLAARDEVKAKVREGGGTHSVTRVNGTDESGRPYTEYVAAPGVKERRKAEAATIKSALTDSKTRVELD